MYITSLTSVIGRLRLLAYCKCTAVLGISVRNKHKLLPPFRFDDYILSFNIVYKFYLDHYL